MFELTLADVLTITYLALTLPLTFYKTHHVLWLGLILRLVLIPVLLLVKHIVWRLCGRKQWFYIWNYEFNVYTCICNADAWIPPLLWTYFYTEIGKLITNIYGDPSHTSYYDDVVLECEETVFHSQPAHDLRQHFPSGHTARRLLGEYLHFCYFSFYFVIAGTLIAMWIWRRGCGRPQRGCFQRNGGRCHRCRRQHLFRTTVAALCGVFYVCFVTYLLWPVKGPYYLLERAEAKEVGYFFSKIVHHLLNSESSQGTATPSSHCAIAVACWTLAWMFFTRWALVLTLVVPGLVFATVWCGFHYATDAIVGSVLGGAVAFMIALACSFYYDGEHLVSKRAAARKM